MPSNNNSSKTSMSFGKGKNGMALVCLSILILIMCVAYYFAYQSNQEGFDGDASKLTPASGEVIVALFYAPWCGHCKTFKPEFDNAMSELDGKKASKSEIEGKTVRFAKINCDEEENKPLAKKYNVNGYPTVKILSDNGSVIEYDGERSSDGMRKYLTVDN
jgi:thiol-disulfide isomerase/thioredoxin